MVEPNKCFAIAWQAHLTRKENFYEILKCACHSPNTCNLLALALASLALAFLVLASLGIALSALESLAAAFLVLALLALALLALALLALALLASVVSGTSQQVSRRYHAANWSYGCLKASQ